MTTESTPASGASYADQGEVVTRHEQAEPMWATTVRDVIAADRAGNLVYHCATCGVQPGDEHEPGCREVAETTPDGGTELRAHTSPAGPKSSESVFGGICPGCKQATELIHQCVGPDRTAHLEDALEWWRSEWEIKNREAEWLWLACFALSVICGACFVIIGTVVG